MSTNRTIAQFMKSVMYFLCGCLILPHFSEVKLITKWKVPGFIRTEKGLQKYVARAQPTLLQNKIFGTNHMRIIKKIWTYSVETCPSVNTSVCFAKVSAMFSVEYNCRGELYGLCTTAFTTGGS